MKINNKREVFLAMYGLVFLIILDLVLLTFAKKLSPGLNMYFYIIVALIFGFCIWRIAKLKVFALEVSEHIFSVKYRHPFINRDYPVLELPLEKIISVQTKKGILNYILLISIRSKKGIKNFYYNLGKLPENQSGKFREISNFIRSNRLESYH